MTSQSIKTTGPSWHGSDRLIGIDLARFIALVSMFVAHTAPSAGPGGVLNLSEFLTAPLFATLIGISALLSSERMAFPALFAGSVVRGIVLIALGLWLGTWGAQVDIVLEYLGLLSVMVAVLVYLPTWLLTAFSVLTWWFTPWAMNFFESYHLNFVSEGSYLRYLTLWMFEGENYRVFTMIGWAAAGIVLIRLLRNRGAGLEAISAVLLSIAAAVTWWHAHNLMEFFPYTGNRWEVGLDTFLALAVVSWSLLLASLFSRAIRVLEPFAQTGRMTLSIYVLQIGILALYNTYAESYGLPVRDDSWPMMVGLIVVSLFFSWVWNRLLGRTILRRGPLETPLALLTGRG